MPSKKSPTKRTVFTPVVRQSILDAVETGGSFRAAAAAAGIGERQFCKLMETHPDFAAEVRMAEGRAELALVKAAREAVVQDPRLALKFLQARFSADWNPGTVVKNLHLSATANLSGGDLLGLAAGRRSVDRLDAIEV